MILKVMCGTHLFNLPVASLFPGCVNKIANVNSFLYLALNAICFQAATWRQICGTPLIIGTITATAFLWLPVSALEKLATDSRICEDHYVSEVAAGTIIKIKISLHWDH